MLEKLKSLVDTTKNVLIFVVAPILSTLAYIFYLRSKNSQLESDLNHEKVDDLTKDLLSKEREASDDAKEAEEEYNYIRDNYKRNAELRDGGKGSGNGPEDAA